MTVKIVAVNSLIDYLCQLYMIAKLNILRIRQNI